MSSATVWTLDEFSAVTGTSELRDWLPIVCPLVGAWSGGGWFDEAIGEVSHDDWSGMRQTSQNF